MLGGLFATCHHDLAGAHCFDDFILRKHRDRRINFWAVTSDHHNHRIWCEVYGFSTEVLCDLQGARATFVGAKNFDQDHFLGDRVVAGVFEAMNHVDQFPDLLDDLIETRRVAGDADGHARKGRIAALRNNEGIDVETAAREDLTNPHEHAGSVVHEDGKCVARTGKIRCNGSVGCRNHKK